MGSQTDYFNRIAYKAKYSIGDRVSGKWNKIPFIGSVGNDTVINLEQGPRISVQVDLPIRFEDRCYSIIIVKHKDIKLLKDYDKL